MSAPALLRAALPAVPLVNRLPGVRKHEPGPGALTRTGEPLRIERERVAAYAGVGGYPVRDTVPLPYLHVLGFPLHLALMSDPGFPAPALGMVHLANTITRRRPVRVGETVRASATVGAGLPHPAGTAYVFHTTVISDGAFDRAGETVWESSSTYLRRGERHPEASWPAPLEVVPPTGPVLRFGGDLGRRYADVSGDYNPIHLTTITAKAFGFRRQIAHGMCTLAHAAAYVDNRLPDAVRLDVEFRKPVFLPGTVALGVRRDADGYSVGLSAPDDPGRVHLTARAAAL